MLKIIVFIVSISVFAFGQNFKILTEEAPPFNYYDDGEIKGLSVDVVKEILKRVEHPDNIKITSWSKGYNATKDESGYALFGTSRTEARENLFKWVGPIATFTCVLYARKDFDMKIDSLEDAKKVKAIGVYKDDVQEQTLKDLGFTNLLVSENNIHNPIKLASGEIDLWAQANASAVNEIKKTKIPRDNFKVVHTYCENGLFIAFSKDTKQEIIDKWQDALDGMKKDGAYERILSKHL